MTPTDPILEDGSLAVGAMDPTEWPKKPNGNSGSYNCSNPYLPQAQALYIFWPGQNLANISQNYDVPSGKLT